MALNHGGDPLGSISGSMGTNWDQKTKKWVKTVKNYHAPNSNFWLLHGHRFGQSIEFTVMMPNHGGEPLRSILRPMGPIGAQKWVKTVKNCHAPKFEFLTTPRSSICAKNRIYSYGAKSRWGTPEVHPGADGVPLGLKNGSKPLKIAMPQIRICDYSAVIDLGKKSNLRLWRQITVGTPYGPSWGQWGPIGAKKWVKTVKNCHAPKFEFLTTTRSSIWAKNRIYGYDSKSRWGPPRSILGPMGSHWGQKMGQNRKKLPCPKIRILTTPRSSIWANNRIYGYGAKSQ